MIKAIIFDYFDVLRPDGLNIWLNNHDLSLEMTSISDITRQHDKGELSNADMFAALGKVSDQSGADVEAEMESSIVPDWDMITYVGRLRGEYKTALLSNSAADYLRAELRRNDLERYFDEIVISAEVGIAKPQPEVFQLIADKLGVKPHECVFIDDNPGHVEAARQQGITGIVFKDKNGLDKALTELRNAY